MNRTERIVGILAAVVTAAVSVATKPRMTGWRSPATPIPHTLRLTPDDSEAVVSYRAELNAVARGRSEGKRPNAAAEQVVVELVGSVTWVGAGDQPEPAALDFAVTTPAGRRGNARKVGAVAGESVQFGLEATIPVDPTRTRCPPAEPCPMEFDVDVRWLEPAAGVLDVEWTMTAAAFGATYTRRDKEPPEGAKITVREIRPE